MHLAGEAMTKMRMNLDELLVELKARGGHLKPVRDQYMHFERANGSMESAGAGSEPHRVYRGELGDIGKYNSNNGALAFVDKCLQVYVGRNSAESVQALRDAGYVEGSIYVPHSNDCGREELLG